MSSYPTYEEWKLEKGKRLFSCFWSSYPTYEEWKPDRDDTNQLFTDEEFLSYLWGMETRQNIKERYRSEKLFLSYLWGMETNLQIPKPSFHLRSYPTYEEWKQENKEMGKRKCSKFLSYLWGMETRICLLDTILLLYCSYPTYEEWKQGRKKYVKGWFHGVLILPMRNGNTKFLEAFGAEHEFLSYLWGMETLLIK